MSVKSRLSKTLFHWSRRLGYAGENIPAATAELVAVAGTDNRDMLGRQKSISAAILYANLSDFSNIILTLEAKEIFRYINTVLAKLIPVIERNGGETDHFSDAGVTALFSQDYRSALISAISMCQEIQLLHEPNIDFDQFSIGLCNGSVMIGAVGEGKRYSTLTISEYTGLAKYLQSIAGKYYSKILITGSYADLIEDFDKRFSSRQLGYVYLSRLKKFEKLYDVYDGDNLEIRNKKRKSKLMFDKGVTLFADKKYNEARLHFVEVLKADRHDLAAKEYVFLCDRCAAGEEGFSQRTYLEVW